MNNIKTTGSGKGSATRRGSSLSAYGKGHCRIWKKRKAYQQLCEKGLYMQSGLRIVVNVEDNNEHCGTTIRKAWRKGQERGKDKC